MITHKAKEIGLDATWALHKKDNLLVTLYTKFDLEQNEKKRAFPGKVHVRIHHEDNKVLSIGLENYDLLNGAHPNDLSLYGIIGQDCKNGYRTYQGLYASFKLSTNKVNFHKYLVGLKHNNTNSVSIETGITRHVKTEKEEKLEDTSSILEFDKVIDINADGEVNKDLKVGGDVSFNIDTKDVATKIYASYKIDSETSVKARLENSDTLTLGLTHIYRQLITFGFITSLKLITPAKKEGETESQSLKKAHFKSKFGVYIEFNDTAPALAPVVDLMATPRTLY